MNCANGLDCAPGYGCNQYGWCEPQGTYNSMLIPLGLTGLPEVLLHAALRQAQAVLGELTSTWSAPTPVSMRSHALSGCPGGHAVPKSVFYPANS